MLVDTNALTTAASHEEAAAQDRAFWHAATPEQRLQAVEAQRMIVYGYETPPRLQRILQGTSKNSFVGRIVSLRCAHNPDVPGRTFRLLRAPRLTLHPQK